MFPPGIALAKNAFFEAINKAAPMVWKEVPEQNWLGIDPVTGTGVLALFLADIVWFGLPT